MTMRFLTRSAAGLALAACLSAAVSGHAADLVAQFARAELGLDLSRFRFGTAPSHYPGLLSPDPNGAESGWQRMEIERSAARRAGGTNFLDLRFEKSQLVGLRAMLLGSWTTTNDNVRVLAAFQKLGARKTATNSHRYVLETKEWRMSVEGFCSDQAPSLLQFNVTTPERRSQQ